MTDLLNVGYEGSDVYPTANSSTAKAYPLYNDLVTSVIMSSRTDYNNNVIPNPMGSQIVLSGVSSTTDKELYLPIICPVINADIKNIQRIIFQSVQTTGSKFGNNNNLVFESDDFRSLMIDEQSSFSSDDDNIKTQFPDYNDIININDMTNNLTPQPSTLGLILLSNGLNEISTDKSIFGISEYFTGSNASTFKINDITYNKMYIVAEASNDALDISLTSIIKLFERPTMTTASTTYALKIHGIAIDTDDKHYYFSNDGPLIEPSTKKTHDIDGGNMKVTLIPYNNKAIYTNDSGANYQIKVEVYSELTLTEGSLTLASTSFNSNSICVQDNDISVQVKTSGTMVFTGLSVTGSSTGTWTSFNFTCFNMKTNSTGIVTISTGTNFEVTNFLKGNLEEAVSSLAGTVAVNEADQIVPKVIKVRHEQSPTHQGLGCTFFNIDLGRSYRIGQTIVIKSDISGDYVTEDAGTKMPNCLYSFTSNFNNLDNFQFTNNVSNAAFVDTCEFAGTGAAHTITIKTNQHVPKLADYSQNIVIQLCPVRISNLNTVNYEITTYLNNDTNTIGKISSVALTGDDTLTFPKAAPLLPASLYASSIPNITGLCNLKEIYPKVASVTAQYTFDFVITEDNKVFLDETVNKDSGKSFFNEFSIYVDPKL